MTDLNQVAKLMEGVDAWNQWRSENPDVSISLDRADLRDIELTGANLRKANLTRSNLRDAVLDNADLTSAILERANLIGARARGTLFIGAILKGAQLNDVDGRNARLIGADLSGSNLVQANFLGADMTKAICKDANLNLCVLVESVLKQADLRDSKLHKSQLVDANLEGADLRRCDLGKAIFRAANLSDANLYRAQLNDTNFSYTRLSRTDLREVVGLTCEQLTQAHDWENAYRDEALACGARIPGPNRGVTIEVPASHFRLTGHPTSVTTTEESDEALPATPAKSERVETAEEIDKATSIRFEKTPTVVISEATRARDLTIILQTILQDMRLNSPEAAEAQALLETQFSTLDNVITILQSDGDKDAARKSFRDLLQRVLETYLKVLAEKGPTRGILAAAAIATMSVAGVDVSAVVGTLVAGSIVGIDAQALKKILAGWKKKKNKGE